MSGSTHLSNITQKEQPQTQLGLIEELVASDFFDSLDVNIFPYISKYFHL